MDDEKKDGQTLIEYRLDQIEKKLDTITAALSQTQAQEYRLSSLEKKLEKNIDRWLNPIVAAIVSGLIAFIFMKVGLK